MYIDGEWVDATSGETYEVVDPATEEVVARVPKARSPTPSAPYGPRARRSTTVRGRR